jgi:hypothetical protein
MYPLTRIFALLFLALAFSVQVRAATITITDLPGSIQSCITAATCFVSNTSTYDNGTASAFSITQSTGSGTEVNVLMRYTLVPPSSQSTLDPPQNDALSGYLWMLAKTFYSASETAHPITLYIDKVSPSPFTSLARGISP